MRIEKNDSFIDAEILDNSNGENSKMNTSADRLTIPAKSNGKDYWRSLDELSNTDKFQSFVENEFPEGTIDMPSQVSRKKFLGLMGASLALAGLTACRRPIEKILPYIKAPEEIIPGIPKYYASAMPFGLNSYGIVVETHEGRPTKIEGNKGHSSSMGRANSFVQSSVLNLYDPDRSQAPKHLGREVTWKAFQTFWKPEHEQFLENDGEGLAVLSESFASPTLNRLRNSFLEKFPKATWAAYEPVSDENIYRGLEIATGQVYQPINHFDKADVILSIDSDFLYLESSDIVSSRRFADGRRVTTENDSMNRLYCVENSFSVTGGMADHRLIIPYNRIAAFTAALITELRKSGISISTPDAIDQIDVSGIDTKWVRILSNDLVFNKGKSLVIAGYRQSAEVHAMVYAINDGLQNNGKTIYYHQPEDRLYPRKSEFKSLVKNLESGKINTLILSDINPVYSNSADTDFTSAMKMAKNVIHYGVSENETSALCNWHLPGIHYLETWGDVRSFDNTLSVIQPMIAPLFKGKSQAELFNTLLTAEFISDYDLVRETWKSLLVSQGFDKQWQQVLHDGYLAGSDSHPEETSINKRSITAGLNNFNPGTTKGIEVVFAKSSATFDGRFANNGWLMENPDPVTKVSWDNVASISEKTATKLGLKNKELAEFSINGQKATVPIWIMPGHAHNSITMTLGYGRTSGGRISNNVGVNVNRLKTSDSYLSSDVSVTGTGRSFLIACTQDHHGMGSEKLVADQIQKRLPMIVRESTLDEYRSNPDFVNDVVEQPELSSLWKEKEYTEGYQWGMSIDLNVCTGCNACSIACQSENNIPVVGKDQVEKGREMSWIRLDRYFSGDVENPEMVFQPIACQHCEMAPCEQVCPVTATVHDDEGLNAMVYNRCAGTRYCANNCPYKVRRYNFYNFTSELPEIVQMSQNPNVTVRFRGVMEKCSFCLQRINQAKITTKNENRTIVDGDVVAACQQTCPTDAIVFGNINDPDSKVSKMKKQNRDYSLLGEINTRPRTTFLAKLRNQNSKLDS
ncbi:MAG: TAT-variant-translocated molybdopterin oxidoreductase [Candidatus Marinimicrobia bacterium]|jgi:molybdopterin-containing oxidoreductase family iron-sulfur binding subunit|nr:TAT-variant-translocated molybdopterin oxidoreductase [Candidatus Neomarinimicrobiota bacterium]MBT3632972.1 TAT-variant-translocated molybdopterin oxidoreductase [Candidatus Neomarinimicrobiota bacterium]MBT3682082.1 TAT-variant-translocated molybdopterin oxidoreductase [Candidatus Neomarinimicrobiota bacterium]MBT3758889.1 TAT-variant-translocated molybdopterin oxidoreductase [Candidatus Neomarinimicrobiota bacterium]MBT3895212.1 TAT-variant-translocated molybdopterin oxidoreductase [Candi